MTKEQKHVGVQSIKGAEANMACCTTFLFRQKAYIPEYVLYGRYIYYLGTDRINSWSHWASGSGSVQSKYT